MNDTSLLLSELTHTVDELNRLRSQYNNNNNNNTNTSNLNNSNINSNNIFKEYQKLQQYVKILENEKEQLVIANRHLESKNSFRAKQIIGTIIIIIVIIIVIITYHIFVIILSSLFILIITKHLKKRSYYL